MWLATHSFDYLQGHPLILYDAAKVEHSIVYWYTFAWPVTNIAGG